MDADFSHALTTCPGCGRDVLLSSDTCPHCDAPADTTSTFVSFRYPGGGVGAADQITCDFLRSKKDDPDPKDLRAVFDRTTRVRLTELIFRDNHGEFEQVLEIVSPENIADLSEALAIRIEPLGHLMTIESHRIELFAGAELLATVAMIQTGFLRWDRWRSDAVVADPERLADAFVAYGYPKLREMLDSEREYAERRAWETQQWLTTWERHSHPALLEYVEDLMWQHLDPNSPVRARAIQVLSESIPDEHDQIRLLLGWYVMRSDRGAVAAQMRLHQSFSCNLIAMLLSLPPSLRNR